MESKTRHPINQCQTIRRQLREHRHRLHLQFDTSDAAEQRIQALSDEYFAAATDDERRRAARLQSEVDTDRRQALANIALLERVIEDIENDYDITGCNDFFVAP